VAGQRKPGQLYLRQAISAEILLIEALDELGPPKGIENADWEGFKGYTEHSNRNINIYGSRCRIMPTSDERDATKYSGHTDKSGTVYCCLVKKTRQVQWKDINGMPSKD